MSADAVVPLEGVAVEATIAGFFARVTITQRYRNQESRPIEAVYVFPLDEGAAVCGFEAIVGGVHYVGEVKSREAAFVAYDDALTQGHGAYLLDEERPDVFTASVGNVPPGAEVLLKLTYVSELPLEGDAVRFTLPTTVSPRYAPAGDRAAVGRPDSDALNPPRGWAVPYGLTLTATVELSGPNLRVESPSHPISVALDNNLATVMLAQENTALDRDLVLVIGAGETQTPRVWLARDGDRGYAAAVAFRPTFTTTRNPCDVVFLVDRSGSMFGTSIEQVRNTLQLCLRSLEPGSHFDIVGFGSTFQSLFDQCRRYEDGSLAEAGRHVGDLDADLGGTEILPALEFILGRPRISERALQVVVLTDGQVTNTDAVLALVNKHAASIRVFSFGIGRGASHHLVRGLARVGGGAAEFIYPGERIESKVMRQFERLLAPPLTDVSVNWGDSGLVAVRPTLPPVFAGERLILYAQADRVGQSSVTLSARNASGPLSWTLDIDPANAQENTTVATLAARARIRVLEEGDEWLSMRGSRQDSRKAERVTAEIVRLATTHGLASRETSFVAIEHREQAEAGEVVLRRVPIAVTNGWGESDIRQSPTTTGFSLSPIPAPSSGVMHQMIWSAPSDAADSSPRPSSLTSMSPGKSSIGWAKKLLRNRARDTSSRKTSARAAATSGPVDRLVALQRADGSWSLNEAFAAAIGRPLRDLEHALGDAVQNEETRQAWATAIAVTFLEQNATHRRDEWSLLAEKAKRWLGRVNARPAGSATWTEAAGDFLQAGQRPASV